MQKQLFPAVMVSSLVSLGVALPALAQMEVPPAVLDSQAQEAITGDDDVGLPEGAGVESPADTGLPDVGTTETSGVINLVIDGQSNYYVPVNLDESQLSGQSIPTYVLESGTATTTTDTPENATDTATDDDTAEAEEESGEFVIYPPADSVEDLEPEDILE